MANTTINNSTASTITLANVLSVTSLADGRPNLLNICNGSVKVNRGASITLDSDNKVLCTSVSYDNGTTYTDYPSMYCLDASSAGTQTAKVKLYNLLISQSTAQYTLDYSHYCYDHIFCVWNKVSGTWQITNRVYNKVDGAWVGGN